MKRNALCIGQEEMRKDIIKISYTCFKVSKTKYKLQFQKLPKFFEEGLYNILLFLFKKETHQDLENISF